MILVASQFQQADIESFIYNKHTHTHIKVWRPPVDGTKQER